MLNHSSNPLPSHPLPPPFIKGIFDLFKIDRNRGISEVLLEKKCVGKTIERVCLEMGGLPYYIEVFLEIPYDAA